MANNNPQLDYTTIPNPYPRSENAMAKDGVTTLSQTEGGRTILSGEALTDAWIDTWIKSTGYEPKKRGFLIDGQKGYIECMKLWVGPGGVIGGSLDIPDNVTPASFHVDALGNTWWGATTLAASVASVLNTGLGTFSNIVITGGSIAGVPVSNVGDVTDPTTDIVPTGLTASSTGTTVSSNGTVAAYVTLTWAAIATNTFALYQVRYKKTSYTYYQYLDVKTNTITIDGLSPNVSYDFAICSVNKAGMASAWSATVTQLTATNTTAPATVTGVTATGAIQYAIIEWTGNSESDIASYNIYRNTVNNSGTATLVGNSYTNYFVNGGLTGGTPYYYWVKAVNTSGVSSVAFSTVQSATPRDVTSADIVSIAATKVLIDGAVYLSNWRNGTDLTKIDGGNIYAGSSITVGATSPAPLSGHIASGQTAFNTGVGWWLGSLAGVPNFSIGNPADTYLTYDTVNGLILKGAITITGGNAAVTFYQATEPLTGMKNGDYWIDSDDNSLHVYQGSWVLVAASGVKVFTAEPTTPYHVGDLWLTSVASATGDLKKCVTEKLTGPYNAADWLIATEYTKGAAWGTNLSGIPTMLEAPSGDGLYLSSTYMGFYKSSVWKTYIDNAGNLVLGDIAGGNTGLSWNQAGGTLTIKGAITADSGNVGGWVVQPTYLYYNGALDANSAGMAALDYPFYAGKKYVDRATAPFRVTPAGALYASSATVSGAITTGASSSVDAQYLISSNIINTLTMGTNASDGYIQSYGWDGTVNGYQLKGGATPSFTLIGGAITGTTIKTAATGARVEISGNDAFFYDDSTGGSNPVTGNTASLIFERTDLDQGDFYIQKRKTTISNYGNAMEMFFDAVPSGGERNYLFLGREGGSGSAEADYKTHVLAGAAKHLIQLQTSSVGAHSGWGTLPSSEISIINSGWDSSGINSGGSRVAIAAIDPASPASYASGGACVTIGIQKSIGYDISFIIDDAGVWLTNNMIPYDSYNYSLGDATHIFTTFHCESIQLRHSDNGLYCTFDTYAGFVNWRAANRNILIDAGSGYTVAFATGTKLQIPVGTNLY